MHSIPRIEAVIEIRPVKGHPFCCRAVGVELRTEQKVQTQSTLGSSETVKEYKICGDPMVYSPPMGLFHQELLALDIPVILPLPRDMPPSSYFDNWGATTTHHLFVKFTGGTSAETEYSFLESFAIPVKLYDTLPLYRQYNEPVEEVQISSDNQLILQVHLPVSSLGPRDPFTVDVQVKANTLHNKRKKNLLVKQITLQMREVLECYDGGLAPRKENKFISTSVEFDHHLTSEGMKHRFSFEFPHANDALIFFKKFSQRNLSPKVVNSATAQFNRNKNFPKLADGIPLTHVQGFTTIGKLFSLRYEITVKVKINHGKDIDLTIPITVSPYDRDSSQYLLLWIRNECMLARDRFGKQTVHEISHFHSHEDMQRLLNHYCGAPELYYYQKDDWESLGYDPRAFGKQDPGRPLATYID